MRFYLNKQRLTLLFLAALATHVKAQEPIKIYVLDSKISKAEAQEVFSGSQYEVIDASQRSPSNCDSVFQKSGLTSFTDQLDPYEKKMLILRSETLSFEKIQKQYPKLPASGLKKLMELNRAK